MKITALVSGGKDSIYAAWLASKEHELRCFVSVYSENKESYMFHVPNVSLTRLQAKAADLPIILKTTAGVKEEELEDLKAALVDAKKKYKVEGAVCGALASTYQKSRLEKLCKEVGLVLLAPLWGVDPLQHLKNLVKNKFKVIIVAVAAAGLGREFLGEEINSEMIKKLAGVQKKHGIHIAFEGGEAETLVLDCPLFKRAIKVEKSEIEWNGDSGVFRVREASLQFRSN